MAFQEVDEEEQVLTGVASGALAGASAGPVGALAGGIIGGALASFSASNQASAARKAEKERQSASLKASHLRLLARRQTESLSQTTRKLGASKPSRKDSTQQSTAPTGAVGAGLAASSGTF